MPITSPSRVTSGPPLLPGLMAASVCTSVTPPTARTALTMPRVTELCRTPSGEPTAITSWPLRTRAAEPSGSTCCDTSGFRTRSTAMSTSDEEAATLAARVLPSNRRMVTLHAPGTTWALVRTVSGATKNPLPVLPPASTRTTARMARSATSSNPAAVGAAGAGTGTLAGAAAADVVAGTSGAAGVSSPAGGAAAAGVAGGLSAVAARETGSAGCSATGLARLAEYPIQNASTTTAMPATQAAGGIRHDDAPSAPPEAGIGSRTWPHRQVLIRGGTCRLHTGHVQACSVEDGDVMRSSPLPPWRARTPRRVCYRPEGGRV